MIHKTRGIVFRTIKFSESSVVSKIYTEKFGMQSYIVNGIRSAKSKNKASMLQVMTLLDLEVYHHENRNLERIKEMQLSYIFKSIPFDPLKSSLGLFVMEVLNKCIGEEEGNETMFGYISEMLKSLDRQEHNDPNFLLKFLLDLSAILDFYPHGEFNNISRNFDLLEGHFVTGLPLHPHVAGPPVAEDLSRIIQNSETGFSSSQRRKLLDMLLQYYKLHVPNFVTPKSLHVMDEIFKSA